MRAWLGIRTMEFQACKSNEGPWIFERTAFLLGDFKDDTDYLVSMKKVSGILKNECAKTQPVIVAEVTQVIPDTIVFKEPDPDQEMQKSDKNESESGVVGAMRSIVDNMYERRFWWKD